MGECSGDRRYLMGEGRYLHEGAEHDWEYRPYITGILKKVNNDYWVCSYCGAQTSEQPPTPINHRGKER